MKKGFKLIIVAAVGLGVTAISGQGQDASATISDVAVSGGYDYTIELSDTGGTDLDSFWYGWTQGGNNLPSDPSNAGNSLGWGNDLDGNSIEWEGGTAMTPNSMATFTFFSSSTPAQITASPSGESVAYVGSIDFSQGASGDSTGEFSPVLTAAPEPSELAVFGIGLALATGWRRFKIAKTGFGRA